MLFFDILSSGVSAMVPVRRAIYWRVATSLLLLSVIAAVRVLFVAMIVATNARSLMVAVAKFAMASTVSCQYTWLADWCHISQHPWWLTTRTVLGGRRQKYLELGPGIVVWILYFPLLAAAGEYSSLKY